MQNYYHLEQFGDSLIVRLHGELDLQWTDQLRESLEDELQKPAIKNLLINLSELSYLDSSGLGVLLGRYKSLAERKGRVFLIGAKPHIRRLLELSGLFRIMEEAADEKSVLAALKEAGNGSD